MFIPVSGLTGANVKDVASEEVCPWYRYICLYTVEPLIVDTPNKGRNRKKLSIRDTLWGPFSIILVHFNL